MALAVKTAITIPSVDFKLVEKIRRETGKSRSQILVEAFRAWVESRKRKDLEDLYADAYRKHPEKHAELEGFMKAGILAMEREDW